MISRDRFRFGFGAAICLITALVLLIAFGLPDRATYTGQILADGQLVAPEIGALAPPFSTTTLDGVIRLDDLRGEPALINFWATWCVPCRVEMPEMQAFHIAHPNARVIGVNLGESRELVVDWVAQFGLTYDVAFDPNSAIAARYRLRGQPSTYVISPGGVIMNIFYGPTTRQSLEAVLEPFLRN